MKVISAFEIPTREVNADGRSTRKGSYPGKRLLTVDEPDGLNFIFVRNEFVHSGEQAFQTPRHRHTFAQVKFVERGASNYGAEQFIEEGEIGYFPRMAYYGPQHQENCISNVIQFGFNGEHQKGPVWEAYRDEALQKLKSRGTIADGKFFDTDPATGAQRVRDGVEAVYEEQYLMHTGTPLVMRPASYDSVILMRPKAFAWFESAPGVQVKHLGRFYDQPGPDGDIRISKVRFSGSGSYRLSSDRPQIAWTTTPGLVVEGQVKTDFTCVYSPYGEQSGISGADGVEMFVVELPRLK